jgi:hypothetical protein
MPVDLKKTSDAGLIALAGMRDRVLIMEVRDLTLNVPR